WKTATSARLSRFAKWAILSAGLLAVVALAAAWAHSLAGRFEAYRADRARADEVVRSIERLGLHASWHPRFGLRVGGKAGEREVGPALLAELIPVLLEHPRVWVSLRGNPVRDEDLPALAALRHLEDLDLTDTEVTDAGLGALRTFPELRRVHLGG